MGDQSGPGTQEHHPLQEGETAEPNVPRSAATSPSGRVTRPFCFALFRPQCLEECDSLGLPPSEQGRLDLELKIEDTKENMRKAEVRPERFHSATSWLPHRPRQLQQSIVHFQSHFLFHYSLPTLSSIEVCDFGV